MKKFTRILSLLLALLTLVCAAVPALAAPRPAIEPRTLWAGCEYYSGVDFVDMPESAKIVSIKSANKSVIKVVKEGSGLYDHYLEPLKAGKSKITVKYKYKGKTATISATYTVKKYPNPMTWVKVNGKKLNIKANKYYYDFEKYTKTKATVTIKLAKGWSIVDTWGFIQDPDDDSTFEEFSPKSGKAFKLPKGYMGCVFFTLGNKKGEELQYGVRFDR